MGEIHPTAIVHPDARIGTGTRIGAHAIIEAKVQIGERCTIQENVIVRNYSTLGDDVTVHPFAVIGGDPQHVRYRGEPTQVEIGNGAVLREYVTVNRGTEFGNRTTRIGDRVFLMAYCHVAHDCIVGDDAILANSVHLAGHVTVGKAVVIGGVSAITQFCSVGDYAFIGGGSLLRKDLAPYLSGKGNDFKVQSINQVGLQRQGFSDEAIRRLRKLFKIIFLQNQTLSQALERVSVELGSSLEIDTFLEFVKNSKQGIAR